MRAHGVSDTQDSERWQRLSQEIAELATSKTLDVTKNGVRPHAVAQPADPAEMAAALSEAAHETLHERIEQEREEPPQRLRAIGCSGLGRDQIIAYCERLRACLHLGRRFSAERDRLLEGITR